MRMISSPVVPSAGTFTGTTSVREASEPFIGAGVAGRRDGSDGAAATAGWRVAAATVAAGRGAGGGISSGSSISRP